MVTGGMTPLEGLIGQTTCGDIDPGIVLVMAQRMQWGPEKINRTLTSEGGLLGLVGRAITWDQLFSANSPDLGFVRQVVQYRLLLACGAAIAAMGGLDAVVFSGQYSSVGQKLGPWLESRLKSPHLQGVSWSCFDRPLTCILSRRTAVAIRRRTPLSDVDQTQRVAVLAKQYLAQSLA